MRQVSKRSDECFSPLCGEGNRGTLGGKITVSESRQDFLEIGLSPGLEDLAPLGRSQTPGLMEETTKSQLIIAQKRGSINIKTQSPKSSFRIIKRKGGIKKESPDGNFPNSSDVKYSKRIKIIDDESDNNPDGKSAD
jgi:hypothetical protein